MLATELLNLHVRRCIEDARVAEEMQPRVEAILLESLRAVVALRRTRISRLTADAIALIPVDMRTLSALCEDMHTYSSVFEMRWRMSRYCMRAQMADSFRWMNRHFAAQRSHALCLCGVRHGKRGIETDIDMNDADRVVVIIIRERDHLCSKWLTCSQIRPFEALLLHRCWLCAHTRRAPHHSCAVLKIMAKHSIWWIEKDPVDTYTLHTPLSSTVNYKPTASAR